MPQTRNETDLEFLLGIIDGGFRPGQDAAIAPQRSGSLPRASSPHALATMPPTLRDAGIAAATGFEPELIEAPNDHRHLRAVKPGTGISIVVPAVGQADMTRRCIESILRTTEEPYEIILVSNGSPPEEEWKLRQLPYDHYLHFDRILGYACAMNMGIRYARHEYVCLANNDVTFRTPGWNRILIWALIHYRAAIVSPVFDNAFCDHQQVGMAHWDALYVDYLHFICVTMPRALFSQVGVLDERFFPGGYEDSDFCARTQLKGGRLIVHPAVFCTHGVSKTTGKHRSWRQLDRQAMQYAEKWGWATPHFSPGRNPTPVTAMPRGGRVPFA